MGHGYLSRSTFGSIIHGRRRFVKRRFWSFFLQEKGSGFHYIPLFMQLALPLELVLLALDAAVGVGEKPGADKVDDTDAVVAQVG